MLLLSDTVIILSSVLLLTILMVYSYAIVKDFFEEKNLEDDQD